MSLKDVVIAKENSLNRIGLQQGDYVEVAVSDTGVRIAPDIVGSIFDPYFTTKGSGEGTVMGLAMVHGIVESYGGKITVDSQLGKGTTYYNISAYYRKAINPGGIRARTIAGRQGTHPVRRR